MDASSIITVTLNPTFDRIIDVPRLKIGMHARGRLRSRLPAGKAINVSRALATLGRANTATGWVGRDDLAVFENAMREVGVRPAFVGINGHCRENITLFDPESHVETHIRDAGPTVTIADIERLQAELDRHIRGGEVVVFTGSACGGFGSHEFGGMIEVCISHSARVVVDASGDLLREAVRHDLWLIKPNRDELEELAARPLPTEGDVFDQASLLTQRCRHVVVTLGAEGALAAGGQMRLRGRLTVDAGRVRSTVGCGDAFLAGYIHGLCTGGQEHDETALRYGLALGALSATNERPAHFELDHLDEYLGRVTLQRC
jgi:1-phosphofructokinase family hexose kinase